MIQMLDLNVLNQETRRLGKHPYISAFHYMKDQLGGGNTDSSSCRVSGLLETIRDRII